MTEQIHLTPVTPHLAADLVKHAAQVPQAVAAALRAYQSLADQINDLEQAGITNASPFFRDQKYLYLVHPTAADGTRQREYIGADPARQADALARLDRYKRHQTLTHQANTARACLDRAAYTLSSLLHDLGGMK
jgi:hypothetical protein